MRPILSVTFAVSLVSAGCQNNDRHKNPIHDIPLSETQTHTLSVAIREQYQAILTTYSPGESLILRLNDQSAVLTLTVQKGVIIMAQLVPRNPYPNDVKTPYVDLDADGILESMPAYACDGTIYYNSPLTYGNYLALLTRFGIPEEVVYADDAGIKTHKKLPHKSLESTPIPSSSVSSHIVQ